MNRIRWFHAGIESGLWWRKDWLLGFAAINPTGYLSPGWRSAGRVFVDPMHPPRFSHFHGLEQFLPQLPDPSVQHTE